MHAHQDIDKLDDDYTEGNEVEVVSNSADETGQPNSKRRKKDKQGQKAQTPLGHHGRSTAKEAATPSGRGDSVSPLSSDFPLSTGSLAERDGDSKARKQPEDDPEDAVLASKVAAYELFNTSTLKVRR